jgi:hypothetical protein
VKIAIERRKSIEAQKSFKEKILTLMFLSLLLKLRQKGCPNEIFLEKLYGEKS